MDYCRIQRQARADCPPFLTSIRSEPALHGGTIFINAIQERCHLPPIQEAANAVRVGAIATTGTVAPASKTKPRSTEAETLLLPPDTPLRCYKEGATVALLALETFRCVLWTLSQWLYRRKTARCQQARKIRSNFWLVLSGATKHIAYTPEAKRLLNSLELVIHQIFALSKSSVISSRGMRKP